MRLWIATKLLAARVPAVGLVGLSADVKAALDIADAMLADDDRRYESERKRRNFERGEATKR